MANILRQPPPIKKLPEDYEEVYYLSLLNMAQMVWLQILSVILLIPFAILMAVWMAVVQNLRGAYVAEPHVPAAVLWLAVIAVFFLHEYIHGIAIRWVGLKPRYGAKYAALGRFKLPVVLYATADDALFRRYQFVVVALAPAVVITLGGMALALLLPDYVANYIVLAVVLNGSGAAGDFWMAAVVLRYPSHTLVRDEADSIRVYV
jgi:hypothetical protein